MEQANWVKRLKQYLLVALIFLLQFIFADKCRLFGVAPNFAFTFVLTVSFLREQKYSFLSALILGILLDAVSGRLFGPYTLLFMTVAFCIREFYHSAFSENFLIEAFYGLITCFITSVCFAFFISLFRGEFFTLISRTAWMEFFYNFVIFLVMLFIQKKCKKKRRSVFRL
ncbi:MAG: rod shape-determining protein MreD [Clostridia bacterium]|nr:rod shape-determining protein MreD [Clostridia bacterium]